MFVASGTQHALRMCHIVVCGLPPAVQYFSTLSHKQHDFRKKKKLQNMKCAFRVSLHLFSETFFILRRIERDMI